MFSRGNRGATKSSPVLSEAARDARPRQQRPYLFQLASKDAAVRRAKEKFRQTLIDAGLNPDDFDGSDQENADATIEQLRQSRGRSPAARPATASAAAAGAGSHGRQSRGSTPGRARPSSAGAHA